MRRFAVAARPVMGAVFAAVGIAISLKFRHVIEIWALDNLPRWLTELSVSI